MGEIMNNYELHAPFQNKNAGFSRWTYASREGKEYFLKEFLDPVYPTDLSLSETIRKNRMLDCEEFEEKKSRLYEAINRASDGNAVRINEFFRCDSHYYIATEKINNMDCGLDVIHAMPYETRFLLCKSMAHSMMNIHAEHVVHADIKDTNVMLKELPGGGIAGKIIDFDASFFEDDPPQEGEELGGDQVYLSPEACKFICEEDVELTCKMDVFALGILFHQYFTGTLPGFDTNEYDYVFDAVLDGQELALSEELVPEIRDMIAGMLECEPEDRLSMEQVYQVFEKLDPVPDNTPSEEVSPEEKTSAADSKSGGDWFFMPGDL